MRLSIPLQRFRHTLLGLVDLGEFEGHHAVPRFQEELFEFCRRVRAGARLADARLDLLPVAHGWAF